MMTAYQHLLGTRIIIIEVSMAITASDQVLN
jgi:hypothetical protein